LGYLKKEYFPCPGASKTFKIKQHSSYRPVFAFIQKEHASEKINIKKRRKKDTKKKI